MRDPKEELALFGRTLGVTTALSVVIYGVYVALLVLLIPSSSLAALVSMSVVTYASCSLLSWRLSGEVMAMTFFVAMTMTQWLWRLFPLGEEPSAGGLMAGLCLGIGIRIISVFYQVRKEEK